MEVRQERPDDRAAVRDVHVRAFGGQGVVVADLVDTLRGLVEAGDGLSLVAERSGRVVGHVMFTRSLLDAPRRLVDVHVLSPLGVAPEHQRQGVGAALVQA
ncbi:MAG TPA: GNAT family N-acetyltransferase, partial [Candidatus Dormibacteraeota bacterium]|nr:GNAT family N-acetyltransferase [Candidatus Dormibacteraeota bacterium]